MSFNYTSARMAGSTSYVPSMPVADEHVAFNAELEADLRASCHAVENAASKGYYTRDNAHMEQSDDESVYLSDDEADEEMEGEYVDIPSSSSSSAASANNHPSAEAAAATAAAVASEEPSALAKLAASAVWTMLIPRFDLPAPASLDALAHTLHFALEATQLPRVMTHLALFYLHRLLACADRADPVERQRFFEAAAISNKLTGSQFSAYHRLFTVALAMADAYLDDHAYAGSAWAQVAGDRQPRLWNRFHMQSLDIIGWRLEVPDNDWVRWRSWLGDWWRAVGVVYWSSTGKASNTTKPTVSTATTTTTSASHASRAEATPAMLTPERTPVSDSSFSLGDRSPVTPKDGAIVYSTPSPVYLHPTYGQAKHQHQQATPQAQPLLTPASSFESIVSAKRASSGNTARQAHSHYATPETPVRCSGRAERGNAHGALAVKMSADSAVYGYSPVHRRASLASSAAATAHATQQASGMLPSPQTAQTQPHHHYHHHHHHHYASSTTSQLVTMEPHAFSYGSSYYRR
ncbi:hypothetical protein SYNPS1DRAFT_29186 [Syncephalis pseudoplumigaleata]|uniref:Uncharacterized protein n=1 Tax=Syncephalis pseudoplumigaleata TaxID=1712513 RepID=A0A4P9YYA2_9FUNG|nr:hypothetical protein SYNPS1DRAFT_29186 [Syncephalis pseudoplumigaleata]|eukprot:RKP25067.1 hypothetical protein SYNPS1DRAFT_29186 [Syncephalis pseudoplumigaleata]